MSLVISEQTKSTIRQIESALVGKEPRAPDQFILRLRKVFEADPANPRHFLTIRDMGYRFIANPGVAAPKPV